MPRACGKYKVCSKCRIKKPLNFFTTSKKELDGLHYQCKSCQKAKRQENIVYEHERGKKWRENNKEKYLSNNRATTRKLKQQVIDAYGGKCACQHGMRLCGEKAFEFLSIQHKDGTGGEHVRSLGGPNRIYRWLIKNDFPKGNFELHCMNCNFSKGKYGYCPYSREGM